MLRAFIAVFVPITLLPLIDCWTKVSFVSAYDGLTQKPGWLFISQTKSSGQSVCGGSQLTLPVSSKSQSKVAIGAFLDPRPWTKPNSRASFLKSWIFLFIFLVKQSISWCAWGTPTYVWGTPWGAIWGTPWGAIWGTPAYVCGAIWGAPAYVCGAIWGAPDIFDDCTEAAILSQSTLRDPDVSVIPHCCANFIISSFLYLEVLFTHTL